MRRIFTSEEREELLNNPRISKVLNFNVDFSQGFKDFALLEHYIEGKVWNDLIIHSDQGFHYTHPLYINKLKEIAWTMPRLKASLGI